ncbi:unnamed protein product [Arabis nemorensis]|uniref:Uncharacterized protein n=1 Tax=Arabis nemorensis TaxID=586526 RepID=A0A565CBM2_9BRAS|nr:unnamed protein product [Arabis nemorensis]
MALNPCPEPYPAFLVRYDENRTKVLARDSKHPVLKACPWTPYTDCLVTTTAMSHPPYDLHRSVVHTHDALEDVVSLLSD